MIYNIEEILVNASNKVLNFEALGGVSSGHNGPYFDHETPVRNTAHWLITFSCLYKRTKDTRYKEAAYKAISYLKSSAARPMNASFYCRTKPEKDFCNGLMGQAWAIESLLYAYEIFRDDSLYSLAEEVYLLHDFDFARSIWFRLGVDGSRLSHDETFNHQLWFCAVGSMLTKTPEALERSDLFFENIAVNPSLYSSGVLFHHSSIYKFSNEIKLGIKPFIDNVYRVLVGLKNRKQLYSKSVGYHGFNLYAYELLKARHGKNEFFKSKTYMSMLNAVLKPTFSKALLNSKYSYPYNPPGFEIGFALLNNGHDLSVIKRFLEGHFEITSSPDGYNVAVSHDILTSEARLYELVRILDIKEIKIEL
ncbi:hypothetical protein [Grimontia hollisae]|uniref:hypothetical protein n=1 Tax=Grimontia hollisae TaxID=673 RepID=UPI0013037788|nr:hypothetical protein [Grimontia hollisae]